MYSVFFPRIVFNIRVYLITAVTGHKENGVKHNNIFICYVHRFIYRLF